MDKSSRFPRLGVFNNRDVFDHAKRLTRYL
jgi:hypothetical protein